MNRFVLTASLLVLSAAAHAQGPPAKNAKASATQPLDKEYTDLVVYVQFNMPKETNLAETLAKIQSFRRKIRE